jgi:2-iminobutanoate/2-iminopropanoate deaminase
MKKCIGFNNGDWFSPAVEANGVVYISGQGPVGPVGGDKPAETFEEQVKQTLENLIYTIKKSGYSVDNIVKVNAYLYDITKMSVFNEIYLKYIPEPRPARTTVQAALANGIRCEIDCILVAN